MKLPRILSIKTTKVLLYRKKVEKQLFQKNKHKKVRYFFIKDKADQGEITLNYCPMKQMWWNIFSKPFQGQQFRTMRAMIMNCPMDYDKTTYDIQGNDTNQMIL